MHFAVAILKTEITSKQLCNINVANLLLDLKEKERLVTPEQIKKCIYTKNVFKK